LLPPNIFSYPVKTQGNFHSSNEVCEHPGIRRNQAILVVFRIAEEEGYPAKLDTVVLSPFVGFVVGRCLDRRGKGYRELQLPVAMQRFALLAQDLQRKSP
jgi:hypothetical protein